MDGIALWPVAITGDTMPRASDGGSPWIGGNLAHFVMIGIRIPYHAFVANT
jgi:hypothetical protein